MSARCKYIERGRERWEEKRKDESSLSTSHQVWVIQFVIISDLELWMFGSTINWHTGQPCQAQWLTCANTAAIILEEWGKKYRSLFFVCFCIFSSLSRKVKQNNGCTIESAGGGRKHQWSMKVRKIVMKSEWQAKTGKWDYCAILFHMYSNRWNIILLVRQGEGEKMREEYKFCKLPSSERMKD